jgi:transposase
LFLIILVDSHQFIFHNDFMITEAVVKTIEHKYKLLHQEFDERARRLWAATEATALGHGGVAAVAKATGLAESTIRIGRSQLHQLPKAQSDELPRRIRQVGGGRKQLTDEDANLLLALDRLVEPTARGDPMSPLRWTNKSTRRLARELVEQGHHVSHTKVAHFLDKLGYSLQSTRKTKEGSSHPDRNAQFEYIYEQVRLFQERGQPVVSVDAKKKELIGDFAQKGREYQPKGKPEKVRTYDFEDKELGKSIPYGIYDQTANCGWVSVGVDHDTAEFAVETLRRWWLNMGSKAYLHATDLLVTADGGGSNGSRCRLWKVELQRLADETGLNIRVSHFPPGTSKWNKIEHRMFSHITENWRGRPLVSHGVIVNLIANTTTQAGMYIQAQLDQGRYDTGIKVPPKQMKELNIHRATFHGEDWNYTIKPRESINR